MLYERLVRPLAFRCDPEWVHDRAMGLIRSGLVAGGRYEDPILEQTLMGVRFPNPIGLAAGFDKNAVAVERWPGMGFGFVEIGTVTCHPQPGNDRPRLFRLPADQALINRMGFNNEGSEAVSARLRQVRRTIPLGINLGKSKVTPIEDAAHDYQTSFRRFQGLGDYFVVNVSSPNTPGLRGLQEKGPLLEIVSALREVDAHVPLFVKVAPDLDDQGLQAVADVASETGLAGLIATNTTLSRAGLRQDPNQAGGLSGRPVQSRSDEVLAFLARRIAPRTLLIGVGGVFNADDALRKIRLGAHLVQLYTGWVYGGPTLVPGMLKEMAATLRRQDTTLEDLRGRDL